MNNRNSVILDFRMFKLKIIGEGKRKKKGNMTMKL